MSDSKSSKKEGKSRFYTTATEESKAPSDSQVSGSKSSKKEGKSRLYSSLQTLKLQEGQNLLQHEVPKLKDHCEDLDNPKQLEVLDCERGEAYCAKLQQW